MKILQRAVLVTALLVLAVSVGLISCGGGDGDGGTQAGEESTVQGNVQDVMMAIAPKEEKSTLAKLKQLITFSKEANAQGPPVGDIEVIASIDGEVVATDFTDSQGDFVLTVPPGKVF